VSRSRVTGMKRASRNDASIVDAIMAPLAATPALCFSFFLQLVIR
jgi:hypothetical protein